MRDDRRFGADMERAHRCQEHLVVVQVLRQSSQRVAARCPWYGTCGGCAMQHVDAAAQVAAKQRVLEDNLERIGKVRPDLVLAPVLGPSWGYRNRARLSVHYVEKKGGVLVGFHERRSSFVADTTSCETSRMMRTTAYPSSSAASTIRFTALSPSCASSDTSWPRARPISSIALATARASATAPEAMIAQSSTNPLAMSAICEPRIGPAIM